MAGDLDPEGEGGGVVEPKRCMLRPIAAAAAAFSSTARRLGGGRWPRGVAPRDCGGLRGGGGGERNGHSIVGPTSATVTTAADASMPVLVHKRVFSWPRRVVLMLARSLEGAASP